MSKINSTSLICRRTWRQPRGVWVATAAAAAALLLAGCGDDNLENPPPPPPPPLTQAQCVECHGDVNVKWTAGPHSLTQAAVAGELAEERAGQTPDEVLHGSDPENCIACHGPTSVTANDGMSEVEALGYFFTTTDGIFSETTAPDNSADWPEIGCLSCHDAPTDHPTSEPVLSLFESSTAQYVPTSGSSELCGQCHGSLRFPDTDHLSHDIWNATGGIGVPPTHTMPGATCNSCHMYATDVEETNSSMFHGHSWAVIVQEDGGTTAACEQCHPGLDAPTTIASFQSAFEALHTTTVDNLAAAELAMVGVNDPALQTKLEEAQHNLALAEGDESSGFHNHNYLMAVLGDANTRALEILAALT